MTDTTPQVTRGYLAQLEGALADVPDAVRRDILDGIREELAGLDAEAAALRIEELGDPVFIAAEAREASNGVAMPPAKNAAQSAGVVPAKAERTTEAGWYIVLASLLVAVGLWVVPVAGWVFGIGMVWAGRSWTLIDKLAATFTALVACAVPTVFLSLMTGSITGLWTAIILFGVANVPVGVWLLWRGLRSRNERATNVQGPRSHP